MQGPQTTSSVGPGTGKSPAGAAGPAALPRNWLLILAVLLAALGLVEQQRDLAVPFEPLVLGGVAADPRIGSDLNAVCASADGAQVTVVGDGGLILFSADGGKTWRREGPGQPQAATRVDWSPIATAAAGPPPVESQSSSEPDWGSKVEANAPAVPVQQQAPPAPEPVANQKASRPPQAKKAATPRAPVTPPAPPATAIKQAAAAPAPRKGPVAGQNLHAVACGDNGLALAAGGQGVILYRERAGAEWRLATTPDTAELYGIALDAVGAWAVGDAGTLWSSIGPAAAGLRWQAVDGFARSVSFLDVIPTQGQRVVAVGYQGAVHDSVRGGAPQSLAGGRTLRSLLDAGNGEILALGDGGALLAFDGAGKAVAIDTRSADFLPQTLGAAAIAPGRTAGLLSLWIVDPQGRFLLFDLKLDDGLGDFRLRRQATLSGGRELKAIHVIDAERAWIVGAGGTLLSTSDGGEHWQGHTRPPQAGAADYALRLPSPGWFALLLLGSGSLYYLALRRSERERQPVDAVVQATVSDRPLSGQAPDALGLRAIAASLASFMLNESTRPPLTVAVRGAWGSGKSSLMSLLCDELEQRSGYRPVWFNAWHHQSGEQLLASLFASIRAQATPGLCSLAGLSFRADLLWLRARRNPLWSAVMMAVAGIIFYSLTTEQDFLERWAGIVLTKLLALVNASDGGAARQAAEALGPLGAALLPLIALFQTLRAFKLNPAALVTTDGGRAQRHQPAARHRFAAEFEDFTEALKPWRLVLVIDDLDRCSPGHVAEIMETVNFLVTSGECFVVLGMETLWVEAALAVELEQLSKKMEERREAAGRPGEEDLIHRYLRKLINIEIRVPRGDEQAALRVLAGLDRTQDDADPAAIRRAAEAASLAATREQGRRRRARMTALLAAAVLAGGSYALAALVPRASEPPAAPALPEPEKIALRCELSPAEGRTLSCTSSAQAPEGQAAASSPTGAAATAAAAAGSDEIQPPRREPQPARYEEGRSPAVLPALLLAAGLLVVMLGLLLRLRIGGVLIRDSEPFAAALRIWLPFIASRLPTPRDLKRFLNLLRYFAARLPPGELADADDDGRLVAYVVLRRLLGLADPQQLMRADGLPEHLEAATRQTLLQCRQAHEQRFGSGLFEGRRLAALGVIEAEIDFR